MCVCMCVCVCVCVCTGTKVLYMVAFIVHILEHSLVRVSGCRSMWISLMSLFFFCRSVWIYWMS